MYLFNFNPEHIAGKKGVTLIKAASKKNPTVLAVGDVDTEFLHRLAKGPTKNRKHLKYLLVVNDKVFAHASSFFKYEPQSGYEYLFLTVEDLKEKEDPVKYIVDLFKKDVTTDYFKIRASRDFVLFTVPGENHAKLVTRKTLPQNAVPISLNPLRFLQIGKCKALVTNGKYWLKDDIGECNYKWLSVAKSEDGLYGVSMFLRYDGETEPVREIQYEYDDHYRTLNDWEIIIEGDFVFEKREPISSLVEINKTLPREGEVVFLKGSKSIVIDEEGIVRELDLNVALRYSTLHSMPLAALTELNLVVDGEEKYYVPHAIMTGVIGL